MRTGSGTGVRWVRWTGEEQICRGTVRRGQGPSDGGFFVEKVGEGPIDTSRRLSTLLYGRVIDRKEIGSPFLTRRRGAIERDLPPAAEIFGQTSMWVGKGCFVCSEPSTPFLEFSPLRSGSIQPVSTFEPLAYCPSKKAPSLEGVCAQMGSRCRDRRSTFHPNRGSP